MKALASLLAAIVNHLLTPLRSTLYRVSQILCGGEEGLIWRYEYIDDATLELLSQWKAS